jgi:hypothetical protein
VTTIFFTSPDHKNRFVEALQHINKVYDGKLDPEYAAALYILTVNYGTWEKTSSYVDRNGIDFEAMLKNVYFGSGHTVLVTLACNLFNEQMHIDPIQFLKLDDENFKVALTSLMLRRGGYRLDTFK